MKKTLVLGLMSGTSLDGLDLALCEFKMGPKGAVYEIIAAQTIAYDSRMSQLLSTAIEDTAIDLLEKHQVYGKWLGEKVLEFLKLNKLQCDYIASHGHTVHHHPAKGYTFQLGSGQIIANTTNKMVVSDFRSLDISLGGQGAPLVPIGDLDLFKDYKYCLNIGGISNISIKKENSIIAYDLGLANIMLNYLATKKGLKYDSEGAIAASGNLHSKLFEELNHLEYHLLKAPKSLGVEFFNSEVKPLIDNENISIQDRLYTATHHIAYQIKRAVQGETNKTQHMLITGGGAKNTFLMDCIQSNCSEKVSVVVPNKQLVDYKEALIFAYMGWLNLQNKPNCLMAVTGASKDSIGGYLFRPQGI